MPPKRIISNQSVKIPTKRRRLTAVDKKVTKLISNGVIGTNKDEQNRHVLDYYHFSCIMTEVYQDYDCVLYQPKCEKFFLLQLVKFYYYYSVWTRWGRMGKIGKVAYSTSSLDVNETIRLFEQKFKEKTGNEWKNRTNFVARPGKYTIMTLAYGDTIRAKPDLVPTLPCTLDKPTEDLMRRITDEDTFVFAMRSMHLDVGHMQPDQLTTGRLNKALGILNQIGQILISHKDRGLKTLSSTYYKIIPRYYPRVVKGFPRTTLPTIINESLLLDHLQLVQILSDICLAKLLERKSRGGKKKTKNLGSHRLDKIYKQLNCKLEYMDPSCSECKLISDYFTNTTRNHIKPLHIWKLDRKGEANRMKKYNNLGNRKLLFYPANIASALAILKKGVHVLRLPCQDDDDIKLNSRVLGFTSQAEMGLTFYCGDCQEHYIMFVVEVILGREFHVFGGDKPLSKPPDGYDSVVNVGRYDSDEKEAKSIKLDGHTIHVPFGPAVTRDYSNIFYHNQYFIPDESRCRLRYMIKYVQC